MAGWCVCLYIVEDRLLFWNCYNPFKFSMCNGTMKNINIYNIDIGDEALHSVKFFDMNNELYKMQTDIYVSDYYQECQNYTLQTNSRHCKKRTKNTKHNTAARKQLAKNTQFCLLQQVYYKTKMNTNYFTEYCI